AARRGTAPAGARDRPRRARVRVRRARRRGTDDDGARVRPRAALPERRVRRVPRLPARHAAPAPRSPRAGTDAARDEPEGRARDPHRRDPRAGAPGGAPAQALLAEVRAEGAEVMFRRTERLDRETAEGLVDAYWLFCRDLVLAKAGAPASLLADAGRVAELAREAETWTLDDLLGAIELCRQAREALLRNVAPRLTIEVILSRLALRAA